MSSDYDGAERWKLWKGESLANTAKIFGITRNRCGGFCSAVSCVLKINTPLYLEYNFGKGESGNHPTLVLELQSLRRQLLCSWQRATSIVFHNKTMNCVLE